MNEFRRMLLVSLEKGAKRLDIGHSPVSAIHEAFDMIDEGLVELEGEILSITALGRKALAEGWEKVSLSLGER